ncbi:hypothetical protein D9756_010638 [Leucocoprinus leucothites]|uniref:DUF6534 domain-containing protein n=1 Tax=Leucocoprinus leucothites TaxID=201217 RepID=A0A8H5FSL1_9AGAR|nr:hypothetical protein D9756_010638 [Leucoagaricus leucothites]
MAAAPTKVGPLATGPPLIGVALNWWLYGILVMQYCTSLTTLNVLLRSLKPSGVMYINHAGRDRKFLRIIVHFIFLVDTVQTIMMMDDVFYWFVYNFGDTSVMFQLNLASIDGPFLDAVIALTVQLVYCWRIWVLGKWRVLPAVAALLALGGCASGMFVGIHDAVTHTVQPVDRIMDDVWLFLTAVTDILIAGSMTYLLLKFQSTKTSQSTMAAVKRILVLTVETNAVTTVLAIVLISMFLVPSIAPPKTNLFLVIGYNLGKMYSNCFMVLLNQRLYHEASSSRNASEHREGIRVETFTTTTRSNDFALPRQATSFQDIDGVGHDRSAGQVSVIRFSKSAPGQAGGFRTKDVKDIESFSSDIV